MNLKKISLLLAAFAIAAPAIRAEIVNITPQSISLGPNIRKGIADGSIRVSDFRQQILSAQLPNEALRRGLLKELAEIQPPRAIKIGRNELCPCGSGKKYKKCCGR